MLMPSIFNDHFVENLFDDMFTTPFMNGKSPFGKVGMNTDVQEFGDRYQLDIELPGYEKEDIQAELKDGYLTIKASHSGKVEQNDNKGNFIRRERYMGQSQRSFYVGKNMKQEDIKASFENGVLKLIVPKRAELPAEEKQYIRIEG
ncbi:Hsp20/alpha crystallin family protein [Anaeromicropila herbilytica]|uniref:Molecular chaperone Hsp20 n=1 Tax=Anaeromicropila herbilytica TaxID=2785025 RepID=A0A7R7EIK5_9FIRM|nr:Hsp20/alpha crystallin family protein [Anaeromicropila herbilytica]BCN29394.1 molecular chaperone Hsp20 [Anaeromicropila herbilytica]